MKRKHMFKIFAASALISTAMVMSSYAAVGWVLQNGSWYYYEQEGNALRDTWKRDGEKWYYLDHDGIMTTNRLIDGMYFVNADGLRVKNEWAQVTDNSWDGGVYWYYFGSDGKAVENGFRLINGQRYYFEDCRMQTGWLEVDGNGYYMDANGAMCTGWQWLPNHNYDDSYDYGESWYWFTSDGKMIKGREQKINGVSYIFDQEGRMLNGWVNTAHLTSSRYHDVGDDIDALKYYNEDGSNGAGWMYLTSPDGSDEAWYYFRDGRAYNKNYKTTTVGGRYGMTKISGKIYCFDQDGKMMTGEVETDDGKSYYFDENGAMLTGRVVLNDDEHYNEVYYFDPKGSLGNVGSAYTGVNNGYLYDNGALVAAADGMRYEVVKIGGLDYLVNESGKVKTSGTVTDGDGVKFKVEKRSDGGYDITRVN